MADILQTTCAIIQSYFSTELIRADATGCSFPIEQRDKTTATWQTTYSNSLQCMTFFILIRNPLKFVPKGPSKGMSGLI